MPKFNAEIDLAQSELRNAVIQNLSVAPSSPKAGQVFYNTTVPGLQVWQGGAWVTLGAGPAAATTGAEGVVQLAGDLGGAGTTAAAPLIGSVSELVNGSNTSPSIKFAASASTGLYSSGTGVLNLAAGSVNTLQATSTGLTLEVATTVAAALTVSTGGLTVSAGGAAITGATTVAGNLSTTGTGTITSAGALTVSSGGLSVTGNSTLGVINASGLISANGGLTVGAAQSVSMGSNVVNNVATPLLATDAANKGYVDAAAEGLTVHASCHYGTTGAETYTIAAGTVTQINGTTIDGGSPAVGDRVMIKNAPAASGAGAGAGSTNTTEPGNGIYTITGNTTNLTVARAPDMTGTNPSAGVFTFVESGTANLASGFVVTTPAGAAGTTYGTTNITWTQFSGAGDLIQGTGITIAGNTISLTTPVAPANGGLGAASLTAHGVIVAEGTAAAVSVTGATSGLPLLTNGSTADPSFAALSLSGAGVTGTLPVANGGTNATSPAAARASLALPAVYTTTFTGTGSATSFTVTPTMNPTLTGAWQVTTINQTTGAIEYCDVTINQTTNVITIAFTTAPASGLVYSVVVVG